MSNERQPRKKAPPYSDVQKQALGLSLARLRKQAGYTMDAAAKALGLSGKGAIDNFEKGRNVIDAIQLRQLARFYETSVDELVGAEPSQARWPFSEELQEKVLSLSETEAFRLENVMRAHLDMSALTRTAVGEPAHHAYPVSSEERSVALQAAELPEPKRNAQRKANRGPQRRQSGGSA